MKYHSGSIISLGDRVKYNGQEGCIALIGCDTGSGSPAIQRADWIMSDSEILILFDNNARLMLDTVSEDDLLNFVGSGKAER